MSKPIVDVVIPAFNEENAIHKVIGDVPSLVREIVVVDNNSKDNTIRVAQNAGATVLKEPNQGYGAACLKGIKYLNAKQTKPDILVFLDGDYADYPEELVQVIEPIVANNADFVVGSRALGNKAKGSLTPQQVYGNQLAAFLLKLFYGQNATDLGPFRAINFQKLLALKMVDTNYGWTVEMQIKAAKQGLRYAEVPINYKERIGVSKVSGTLKGTILASYKILYTLFKYAF